MKITKMVDETQINLAIVIERIENLKQHVTQNFDNTHARLDKINGAVKDHEVIIAKAKGGLKIVSAIFGSGLFFFILEKMVR